MRERVKNIAVYFLISIAGIIGVIISAYLMTYVFRMMALKNSDYEEIILIWFAMGTGFVALPYLILKKKYEVKADALGVKRITKKDLVLCASTVLFTIVALARRNILPDYNLGVTFIRHFGVAFSEEFFSKGVLFYLAQNISGRRIVWVIMSALVFAFGFHSNGDLMINLLYRLPMGIILGLIYLRTESLYLPVLLHIANNVLASAGY